MTIPNSSSKVPIKVGIIGTGGISDAHFKGYMAAGSEIVAIADVNPEALKARQEEWGVAKGYTDAAQLLADPEVQAVSICTPNAFHHPATVAAAKAGVHILCEKPISLNLELAQEMIDAAEEAGVVLQIGHHLRSNESAAKAKAMIDAGKLGRITSIKLRQAHDWGGAKTVKPSFGLKANAGGGTLLDNGCHMFDLARYFGGDVAEVYGTTATLKYDVEVEDTAFVTLRYASGALGVVENTWSATGWEESFAIYGTEGSLEYGNRLDADPVLRWRFRSSVGTTWAGTDLAVFDYFTEGVRRRNHSLHIANFLAAIRGERDVICTGQDGLEAVRLVLKSYESAELGRPVALTPEPVSV